MTLNAIGYGGGAFAKVRTIMGSVFSSAEKSAAVVLPGTIQAHQNLAGSLI